MKRKRKGHCLINTKLRQNDCEERERTLFD
jgi:hypothetical protein